VDRLSLSPREREVVEKILGDLGAVESTIGAKGEMRWSVICKELERFGRLVVFAWSGLTDKWRVRRRMLLYLTRLSKVFPMLTGRDLIDLGVPRGPMVGALLDALRLARMDGEVETLEDERAWVLKRLVEA